MDGLQGAPDAGADEVAQEDQQQQGQAAGDVVVLHPCDALAGDGEPGDQLPFGHGVDAVRRHRDVAAQKHLADDQAEAEGGHRQVMTAQAQRRIADQQRDKERHDHGGHKGGPR